MTLASIRNDFDEIARLSDSHVTGDDRYYSFLVSLVPAEATKVLDIGCGLGELTSRLAIANREVTAVDLSPEMIMRARKKLADNNAVLFLCGNFLEQDFGSNQFDCVISAATLHHMQQDVAIARMVELLRPGGRLIINDIRSDVGLLDHARTYFVLGQEGFGRLLRTGRLRPPRAVRDAWMRHCATEKYLSLAEVKEMASRLLPGAKIYYHWLWRYTIIWDRP
ncbi:MAG TPA: class I SAM-dependent methyltransferase [Pyrinomonadaceae bacterium]|nr:class I SAM-dependent methyltransferase [Pyrinomonadaceae bacterium]